ncbi:TerL protein, partial [Halomonas sp. SIMBA_159]
MDSLFEKARYILKQLPAWMVPVIRHTHMLMNNKEMNSTLAGESTNADIGRGGRKLAYAVDEAAAVPNGEQVETSLSQT